MEREKEKEEYGWDCLGDREYIMKDARLKRMVRAAANFVAIQTVSRAEGDKRPEGERCDYERFGRALREEAEERGLTFEKIGKYEGNYLIGLPPDGKEREQTLLLVAHSDTVPKGERGRWRAYPFRLVVEPAEDGGRMIGRGVNDDISGIIIGLEALYHLMVREFSGVDVKLCITRDEEIGSKKGLVYLTESGLLEGDAALILDAEFHIVMAASGVVGGRVEFRGNAESCMKIFDSLIDYSKRRGRVKSEYRVADAPREYLWGRATPTIIRYEFGGAESEGGIRSIVGGGKTNVIPPACEMRFYYKDKRDWNALVKRLKEDAGDGFSIKNVETGLVLVEGKGGHAAYPYLAKNPIMEAIRLCRKEERRGLVHRLLRRVDNGGLAHRALHGLLSRLAKNKPVYALLKKLGKRKSAYLMLGFDVRVLPHEDLRKVKREVMRVFKESVWDRGGRLRLNVDKWRLVEPCFTKSDRASEALVKQVQTAFKDAGRDSHLYGCLGGLDAPVTIIKGIPTLSTGVLDNDCNIHGENEFVRINDIIEMTGIVSNLCRDWEDI